MGSAARRGGRGADGHPLRDPAARRGAAFSAGAAGAGGRGQAGLRSDGAPRQPLRRHHSWRLRGARSPRLLCLFGLAAPLCLALMLLTGPVKGDSIVADLSCLLIEFTSEFSTTSAAPF